MVATQIIVNQLAAIAFETTGAKLKYYIDNAESLHFFVPGDWLLRTMVANILSAEWFDGKEGWTYYLVLSVLQRYDMQQFEDVKFGNGFILSLAEALRKVEEVTLKELEQKVFKQ